MSALVRAIVLSALAAVAASAQAVTDCSKPKEKIDWLLCSNDRVAVADEMMAMAFRDAFHRTADKKALIADQERWRTQVRDACNDVPCLLKVYQDRTSALETY